MTLLYYDPKFLDHDTRTHPERAERVRQVARHLERTGLAARCRQVAWEPASIERLARIHTIQHIDAVREASEQGPHRIEADTVVSKDSYDVARLAAGAAGDAVQRVVAGEDRTALCIVRPPGHHALADSPMGFCLFNNVAVAARVATDELGLERVLIVDWDVHHGNGTQDAFWDDPRVGFLSIHRWPFYPGTGWKDETGTGQALGMTVNVPVEYGTSRREYLAMFVAAIEKLAHRMRPQLVLVSAGFDSHRADPIGSLDLESEDFQPLSKAVLDVAATHAEGRVVSMLEGGYDPSVLAGCVEIHLRELLGAAENA